MSDHEPISIQELRRRIKYRKGWRSLKNYLEAVELAREVKFIARLSGKSRVNYRVTMAAVELYAPELLNKVPGSPPTARLGLEDARAFLRSLDDKIEDGCAEVIALRVTPQIRELRAEVARIQARTSPMAPDGTR